MNEEQQSVEEQTVSPGQRLQQARKAAGMTVQDIADKLRLKPSHIAQLEADQVDEAISLTFTKGYLKNYAKQVGIDATELLAEFDAFHKTTKEPAKLQSFSRRVAKQANDDRLMLVTYLIVVVVIALVVLWWWQQGSSESASSSNDTLNLPVAQAQAEQPQVQQATPPQVVDSDANQTEALIERETVSAPINDEPEAAMVDAAMVEETIETLGGSNELVQSQTPPTAPAEQAPAVQAQTSEQRVQSDASGDSAANEQQREAQQGGSAPGIVDAAEEPEQPPFDTTGLTPIELVFQFGGECWINITDATGEAIAYGVKAEGRVMPVSGYPPFEVVLGAPEVVQISYNGDVVDMSQFPSGRTARFELPLAE